MVSAVQASPRTTGWEVRFMVPDVLHGHYVGAFCPEEMLEATGFLGPETSTGMTDVDLTKLRRGRGPAWSDELSLALATDVLSPEDDAAEQRLAPLLDGLVENIREAAGALFPPPSTLFVIQVLKGGDEPFEIHVSVELTGSALLARNRLIAATSTGWTAGGDEEGEACLFWKPTGRWRDSVESRDHARDFGMQVLCEP
jgi:hypothetical protein